MRWTRSACMFLKLNLARSPEQVSFFEYLEKIELYCSKENYNLGIFLRTRKFRVVILVLAFLSQEICITRSNQQQHQFAGNIRTLNELSPVAARPLEGQEARKQGH